MVRIMRRSLTAVAVVAACVLVAPATAYAVDGVAVVGTGTIDPGLPCPVSCQMHIDFTIAGGGTDGAGVSSCTFDGDTGADTALSGTGSGSVYCSGSLSVSGSLSFSRTGAVMTLSGSTTTRASGTWICVWGFAPLGGNPITSFAVGGFCVWV